MTEPKLTFEQRREAAVLIDLLARDETMQERVAYELIALRKRHRKIVDVTRNLADFVEYCYTERKVLRGPYARQAIDLVAKADAALAAEGEER